MISVIIPTFNNSLTLDSIRSNLLKENRTYEVIIVGDEAQKGKLTENHSREKVLFSTRRGRGHQLFEGLKIAKGDIILFLHDDTYLPEGWYASILESLRDNKVVGGAFSLKFNVSTPSMNFLIFMSDLLYKLTGEFWGDRAIYIRSGVLMKNPDILDVPLMEDVKLSRYMRNQGNTILLKQHVTTDARTFLKRGIVRHTLRIVLCRFLFAVNFGMQRIYNLYYS